MNRVKRDKSTTLDPIFSPPFFGNQTKPSSSSPGKQAHKTADYNFGAKQSGDSALGSADSLHSSGNEGDIVYNKIKGNLRDSLIIKYSMQGEGGCVTFQNKNI